MSESKELLRRSILKSCAVILLLGLVPLVGFVKPSRAQPPAQFICQFVPHRGGESTFQDLGFVSLLTSSAYYSSAIQSGSTEAQITETTASFSKLTINSEPVPVNGNPSGALRFSLISPAEGTYNRDAGHQAIQMKLSLSLTFTNTTIAHDFAANFQGQLETAPEGHALAGLITTESVIDLPPLGSVLSLVIRVFCVYR